MMTTAWRCASRWRRSVQAGCASTIPIVWHKPSPDYFARFSDVVQAVPVIAIDGPSASGKGTVAQRVAAQLGYHFLDSGALYRLLALAAASAASHWMPKLQLADLAAAD